jgi:prepilin signal peptidase PulO-like enzyme (type II secretory pathway)
MATAMQNSQIRFFVVEHITLMIIAFVVAQVAYSVSKRATSDRARFVRSSIGYVLATVLVLFGIPWWRPFFPGM